MKIVEQEGDLPIFKIDILNPTPPPEIVACPMSRFTNLEPATWWLTNFPFPYWAVSPCWGLWGYGIK